MTSTYKNSLGNWYCTVTLLTGRKSIHLGRINATQAKWIGDRIEELRLASMLNVSPSQKALDWANGSSLLPKLTELGLVRKPKIDSKSIADWWDVYINSRTDLAAGSLKGWQTAKVHAVAFFGSEPMASINVMEAKQVVRDLSARYASTHAKKIVERISAVFQSAVDAGQISENPFKGVGVKGAKHKEESKFYLEKSIADKVLEKCQIPELRVLFALARYGGLRTPTEPISLTWTNVDFTKQRMTFTDSKKKKPRTTPLFLEVETELLALRKLAPLDQEFVIDRARASAATTWRKWLLDAILEAGLSGWPSLWTNLRASCRTDLERKFPPHVCNAWLGHDSKTAAKHYLMVTEEDFARAVE
jgi:integrase